MLHKRQFSNSYCLIFYHQCSPLQFLFSRVGADWWKRRGRGCFTCVYLGISRYDWDYLDSVQHLHNPSHWLKEVKRRTISGLHPQIADSIKNKNNNLHRKIFFCKRGSFFPKISISVKNNTAIKKKENSDIILWLADKASWRSVSGAKHQGASFLATPLSLQRWRWDSAPSSKQCSFDSDQKINKFPVLCSQASQKLSSALIGG